MTTTAAGPATLDFFDPAFHHHSSAVEAARESHWYARVPAGVAVLRYEQAAALLPDPRLRQGFADFFTAQGILEGPVAEFVRQTMLAIEGPDHARLRRLIAQAFGMRSIDALAPRMRSIAQKLVDDFADEGRGDFMADFANRYPARVMFELLDVPADLHESCTEWVADMSWMFSWTAAEHLDRIGDGLGRLLDAAEGLIEQRRRTPGADLITALIAAEEAGDRLSAVELRTMVATLLFASQDTTRYQFGLALLTFASHLDQWALLAAQPGLGRAAAEEVMRVNPTTPMIFRTAVADLEYRDLAAPAGSLVAVVVSAANTDPRVFGDSGFDIAATRPARQLAFGGGPHACIGMALARMELAEALPIVAQRLGPIAVDGETTWRPHSTVYGPVALPLRWGA